MNFKKWNANYRLAAYLGVLTLLWLASGLVRNIKMENAKELAESSANKPAFTVQAKTQNSQVYLHRIKARGKTEPNRAVDVMAEVDGRVSLTPATEGSLVKKGAALCVLESEDRLLRLEQAKAQLEKAKLDYEGALRLQNGGYQSKSQIATAKASLALAEAGLKHGTLEIEKLTIKAPFTGVVEKRAIEAGGFLQRGMPCATLVELSPIVVSAQVSESDVIKIKPGVDVEVVFGDELVRVGKLRFVAHTSDDYTRTFRIEAQLPNADLTLNAGMTADIIIPTYPITAHLISPSLLSLADSGDLGIRTLSTDNVVENNEVQFVGDDKNGVWITGLPDQVTLITVGQEYVSRGQKVNVVMKDSAFGESEIEVDTGRNQNSEPVSQIDSPKTASIGEE